MAKIITIAHQKGGVGKSTLTLNIAYCFSQHVKVSICDLDPQGTISTISSLLDDIEIINLESIKSSKSDVIFIDTPPYIIEDITPLLLQSDLVIIPTKPGVPDIMAIKATITNIKNAQKSNSKLVAAIVVNMIKPRTNITEQAIEQLSEYKIPVIGKIMDRVVYNSSFLNGGVLKGKDELAKTEMQELVQNILELL